MPYVSMPRLDRANDIVRGSRITFNRANMARMAAVLFGSVVAGQDRARRDRSYNVINVVVASSPPVILLCPYIPHVHCGHRLHFSKDRCWKQDARVEAGTKPLGISEALQITCQASEVCKPTHIPDKALRNQTIGPRFRSMPLQKTILTMPRFGSTRLPQDKSGGANVVASGVRALSISPVHSLLSGFLIGFEPRALILSSLGIPVLGIGPS